MTNETVSVVIPVFNSARFLGKSIESILEQIYKDIEIIAVDDGSTDNSLEILQRYSDKITIISQSNRGLANALNVGISKMSGRWFKWFSPDDIMYPDAIKILVNEAKKLPENTIVYSNWEMIDENDKKLRDFAESNYNDLDNFEFNVRLLDGQQINVNTTLIPSHLFESGCLFESLDDPAAIDYVFFLRASILYDTKFHLIQKNLVKYRIQSGQLSHKNIAKTLSYLSKIRGEILSELEHSKQKQYHNALAKYEKTKPFSKKTMEFGLKIVTKTMPDSIADRLLVFYLNKIRRSR